MVRIAVATLDGRAYYRLSSELKRCRTPFRTLKPGDPVPLPIKVVLTTPKERGVIPFGEVVVIDGDVEGAVGRALGLAGGLPPKPLNLMNIGIDPGKTIGVAVVGDGSVIWQGGFTKPSELIRSVKEIIREWRPGRVVVKIGSNRPRPPLGGGWGGEGWLGELARRVWAELGGEGEILFVDEKNTTTAAKKRRVKRGEKDGVSALEIALR